MTTYSAASSVSPHAANTVNAPPGTFAPGTKVQVGSHRVVIEKYLSEGGFAHVYVVKYATSSGKTETAVLKRVAVPDKDALANMRTEVETMKKLQGHKRIVTYIDSHASQLKDTGYEVFLLMEYCRGGGLIDFMNTRLKDRLTEPEILHIFSDAAEGLACMHYLKPPLLHRDLKIENILITTDAEGKRIYKLCDFGSTAPPRPAATNATEGRLIEDDIQKHTTLQYRSPEMIDVYRNRPIDEKSDIWALGVMLYKLCYYTTPFEDQGQMAILTASFKFPPYPPFSDKLKLLIATMLTEEPRKRPNIYEVVRDVCKMRGKALPIKDIYANRTASEARSAQELPPRQLDVKSPPMVGASFAPPESTKTAIPDIAPMRRGRPTSSQHGAAATNRLGVSPSKAPVSSDPFAALDSSNYDVRAKAVEHLSHKYPAIEDFSLLQNKDSKFKFDTASPPTDQAASLSTRVTHALADEAFTPRTATAVAVAAQAGKRISVGADVARAASRKDVAPPKPARAQQGAQQALPPKSNVPSASMKPLPKSPAVLQKPETLSAPASRLPYVSTGTLTSEEDLPPKPPRPSVNRDTKERPAIWRVPMKTQSPGLAATDSAQLPRPEESLLEPRTDELTRPHSPSSSRPSLEGSHRPTLDVPDTPQRSLSASSRPDSKRSSSFFGRKAGLSDPSQKFDDEVVIESNVDFLKAMEEQEASKSSRRMSGKQHLKTASVSSVSKGLFGGRFGDALKRFEGGRSPHAEAASQRKPEYFAEAEPILASESGTAESAIDETEDVSPEMRRELERRRLSQEEKRVAQAAQQWREQSNGGRGGPSKASAIQARVKNLLDESGRQSAVKRQAEGYGRYTAEAELREIPTHTASANDEPPRAAAAAASSSRRPDISEAAAAVRRPAPTQRMPQPASPAAASARSNTGSSRPPPPTKPAALRTGGTSSQQIASPGVAKQDEDWEATFAAKYPRISLDMVETDIAKESTGRGGRALRVKEI